MEQLEKEMYQRPVMDVTKFENEDIITTSSPDEGSDGTEWG